MPTAWGETSIMSAQSTAVFDHLLSQGAGLTLMTDDGPSVLASIAAFSNNSDILPHIVQAVGANLRCLDISHLAFATDQPEIESLRIALRILNSSDRCANEKREFPLSSSVHDAGHPAASALLVEAGW